MGRWIQRLALLLLPLGATAMPPQIVEQVVSPTNPVLVSDVALVSHDGLFAFALEDGTELWSALSGQSTSAVSATTSRVLIGAERSVWALEPGSGLPLWQAKMEGRAFSPVLAGEMVLATDTSGLIRALRGSDGEAVWQRRLPGWIYPPALASGVVVANGQAHRVWGLDQSSGRTLWQHPLSQESVYRPVIADGLAVVTTYSGEVLALRPTDGRLAWKIQDPVPSTSPILSQGVLLLLGFDGQLRARRATNGELLWDLAVKDLSPGAALLAIGEPLLVDGPWRQWLIDVATGTLREWHPVGPPVLAAALRILHGLKAADFSDRHEPLLKPTPTTKRKIP